MINPNLSPFTHVAPPVRSEARSAFWTLMIGWIVASLVGFAAGVLLLSMPDNRLTSDLGSRAVGQLLLLLGLPSSIAQWWVLRHHVRNASFWILATLGGSVVAIAVAAVFPPYTEPPAVILIPIFVSVAQTLALWHFVGRPTSAVLGWVIMSPLITGASWGAGLLLMFMTANFTVVYMRPWYDVLGGFTIFIGLPIAVLTGLYLVRVFRDIRA
ncbi:MAG: hypothetical protein HZB53_18485 [Chloroflexi bacterium]|nr:hypothetical protein [Chloroflexota bacterium]